MATSFDCFGTLVAADRPKDPAQAVGKELAARGVDVPDDWAEAYREPHIDVPDGAELPLPAHVSAALDSRGVAAPENAARRAVVSAFDPEVETLPGAVSAVATAAEQGRIAVCSNCAVPGLVRRALLRSELDRDQFDCIVTSVSCGWRKPDRRAFEAVAKKFDVDIGAITHVGDSPDADGGIEAAGGTFVHVADGIDQQARGMLRGEP